MNIKRRLRTYPVSTHSVSTLARPAYHSWSLGVAALRRGLAVVVLVVPEIEPGERTPKKKK